MTSTNLSRRDIVKLAAITPAALAPLLASGGFSGWVRVFDSRLPETATSGAAGAMLLDVADVGFASLRRLGAFSRTWRVGGATRWSDFLVVRSILEERGARLRFHRLRRGIVHWEFAEAGKDADVS